MWGRFWPHDSRCPTVGHILLKEMSQLVIHTLQLCFVEPHHEGRQSEAQFPGLPMEPYKTTPDHIHQSCSGLLNRQSDTFGYHVNGFHIAA